MKENIKRKINFSFNAFPDVDSSAYKKINESLKKSYEQNPEIKEYARIKFAETLKLWELQRANGIGLYADKELRYYLFEFNNRTFQYGIHKMPLMFNVMEAFFHFDKDLFYWRLLDEEDFSISFYDYIDFYTSHNSAEDDYNLSESFEEDLIYNFNANDNLREISFKTDDGNTFVIGSVSMVKRGNEITMLFTTGEILDIDVENIKIEIKEGIEKITPGKEKLLEDSSWERGAAMLGDDSKLWKTLVACRLNLDNNKLDARYIAKDQGDHFDIKTDDITGFITLGEWKDPTYKKYFENSIKDVEKYNSIFELAKACLHLPTYLEIYNDDISEETIDTEVKNILKGPLTSRKYKDIDSTVKIRNRTLWELNPKRKHLANIMKIRDDKFTVETSGYWKPLNKDEIGKDKKGAPMSGRTWVSRTESFYQAKEDELIIEKKGRKVFTEKNAGYIYIMRNPSLDKDVYKIGLTRNITDDRAKQLSNTSIPDTYSIMREWHTKDCVLAEKEIHKLLEDYRIDTRREFFKIDMRIANDIIDEIIDLINK
jgi:hypothetical protein